MHLFPLILEQELWHHGTHMLNNVTGTSEWCKVSNAVSSRNIMHVLQTKNLVCKTGWAKSENFEEFHKMPPRNNLRANRRTCPCKRGFLLHHRWPSIAMSYLSSCSHVFRFWSHCSNSWKIVAICHLPLSSVVQDGWHYAAFRLIKITNKDLKIRHV